MKSNIFILSFMDIFDIVSKKTFASFKSQSFLLCFFSQIFVVLGSTFRSVIKFKLISV